MQNHINNKLPWGLEVTQTIYLLLSIFLSIAVVMYAIFIQSFDLKFMFAAFFSIIYWILFYGVWKTKSWVVTPILFVSAITFLSNFVTVLSSSPGNQAELIYKSIRIVWIIFHIFQLYIFTRLETRQFFKIRGTTLVS